MVIAGLSSRLAGHAVTAIRARNCEQRQRALACNVAFFRIDNMGSAMTISTFVRMTAVSISAALLLVGCGSPSEPEAAVSSEPPLATVDAEATLPAADAPQPEVTMAPTPAADLADDAVRKALEEEQREYEETKKALKTVDEET